MSWLDAVLEKPLARRPTLVDGSDQVSAAAWDRRVRALRQEIDRAALQPGDAVAFPCHQRVGDVLLLLTLLDRRLTVVMQPGERAEHDAPSCRGTVRWRDGLEFHSFDRPERGMLDPGPHLLVRTSGSLDRAKLVVHDPVRLLANARLVVDRLGLGGDDRISVPVPIWHMYGLGAALLPALLAGANIDLIADANALTVFERERRFSPTVAFVTPSFAASLLKARRAPRAPYRLTVCAGDRIDRHTFDAWEDCSGSLVQLYGTTEMGAVAAEAPEMPASVRAVSVGPPFDGVECALDDAGVIQVRSPFGFLGYAGPSGPPAPASAWFATGDRARVEQGRITILGRADLAVNRDGRLVQLEEVERVIEQIAGVERAAVVADGDSPRGVGLVAFVVGAAGHNTGGLRAAMRSALPDWAVPERVCSIDCIPTGAHGKRDRTALAAAARSQRSHR